MSNAIKKILISEKSFQDAAAGKFSFIVAKDASKEVIAADCENLFGVNVLSVNAMNYNGKVKFVKRVKGKRSDFKKAIITVKPGQKIDLFEIESAETKKEKPKKAAKEAKEKKTENTDVEVKIKEKKK